MNADPNSNSFNRGAVALPMKSLIFLLLLALGGCNPIMEPFPPAPLPQSPVLGWKNGTLGKGCAVVKVGTHYEMKCPDDKPGAKPQRQRKSFCDSGNIFRRLLDGQH